MQSKGEFITAEVSQPFYEAYRDLNKAIDEMDRKVEHVIKKHQAQFLYAYRNHIAKIKKELAEIKHKSQQQEKMFSSNDRIQYLEKEMVIFREEALKLYSKVDLLTQENQLLKGKMREAEKEHFAIELQEKEQIKTLKMEEMNKSMLEQRIQELQQQMLRKNEEIARLNRKVQAAKEENNRRSQFQFRERLGSLASSSKRGDSLQSKPKRIQAYQSEMKDWFLDCVKSVKKEIAMRNNNSALLDLSYISGIQQFKTVDKLKLLELFLQNEKMLSWMYERIFPDRLSKLRYNLSSQNESISSNQKSIDEFNISPVDKRLLPRVSRAVKSQLRNSMLVKNGKLNIAHV